MTELPLSWEEIRRREADEASADIPEELFELVHGEEPPQRETRFLDRRASYEQGADHALTLEGYPPTVGAQLVPAKSGTHAQTSYGAPPRPVP